MVVVTKSMFSVRKCTNFAYEVSALRLVRFLELLLIIPDGLRVYSGGVVFLFHRKIHRSNRHLS